MFRSGRQQRHSPNPLHFIMLVFRIYIRKGGRGRPPVAVTNSGFPQESLICYFSCRLPLNLYTLYLDVVGIPPSPKRTSKKKIDFWNYDENNEADKDNWGVDDYGKVGPFFNYIAEEKGFEGGIYNPVSMERQGHVKSGDQARNFVPLSNYNFDVINKDSFYAELFHWGIE